MTTLDTQASLYSFIKNKPSIDTIITADDKESMMVRDIFEYSGFTTYTLPDFRANYLDDLLPYSTEIRQIVKTLREYWLDYKQNKILICPIRTITHKLPNKGHFKSLRLNFGDSVDIEKLKDKLYNWGYYFVDIVTTYGEVSIRGDIIDIQPIDSDSGYRVSLFGDEIESIRVFDIQNQKSSKDELEKITIYPAFLSFDKDEFDKIEQNIQNSSSSSFVKDIHSLGLWCLGNMSKYYITNNTYMTSQTIDELDEVYINDKERFDKDLLSKIPKIVQNKEYKHIVLDNINELLSLHKNKKITIISNTHTMIEAHSLQNRDYTYVIKPYIINLLSKDELIISLNKSYKTKREKHIKIAIDELKPGDMVVHEIHGIGKFKHIEPISFLGATKDFVVLLYQNDDKLLIPVENIDIIDRYVANSGDIAMVDKLGKGSFAKLKAKVKQKLFMIANEIINLAAKRELSDGAYIDSSSPEIKVFQKEAGFVYTKDQTDAINDIFVDFKSGKVMDRVISGDVGFGKTEVALNAMIACAIGGYQSILLSPTTILCSQHFKTMQDRFKHKRFAVARLDGSLTAKEKQNIKERFQNGDIDMIVGTSSLLEIKPKRLGIVIVDEEHKFGVKQKERLKTISTDTHMLSMSATPIPRTLNQTFSNIKTISELKEPPKHKLSTRTYLKELDDKAIKEIVLREKRRDGQLFYIHNNIQTIQLRKDQLQNILPNIKIEIIHSKITQNKTQKILNDFILKKFDILLCTTIVESGLHMPNVNSMIVEDADRFGIADLHQLRGRVGRGDKEGFCYFFVKDKNNITSSATKRLVALESNSYLGSGQALAYNDLQIRGAGNILGSSQSGHIKNIGYSLYIKMLEETISSLSGKADDKTTDVDIKLSISSYICSDLIAHDRVRLELYRRLAKCENIEDVYDIQEEIEDRFGKVDINTKQFLQLIMIKIKAKKQHIKSIMNYELNITIVHQDGKTVKLKSKSKDDDDIITKVLEYL